MFKYSDLGFRASCFGFTFFQFLLFLFAFFFSKFCKYIDYFFAFIKAAIFTHSVRQNRRFAFWAQNKPRAL